LSAWEVEDSNVSFGSAMMVKGTTSDSLLEFVHLAKTELSHH
jgi:hypothetical protein